MNDNAKMTCPIVAAPAAALAMVFMILCTHLLAAQGNPPKYEVDPSWPRPLPNKWVTGAVTGVCTDAQDHVFIVNRGNLTENELDSGRQAPPVIEFDPQGNVANSWGNRETLPEGLHGCLWTIRVTCGLPAAMIPSSRNIHMMAANSCSRSGRRALLIRPTGRCKASL